MMNNNNNNNCLIILESIYNKYLKELGIKKIKWIWKWGCGFVIP